MKLALAIFIQVIKTIFIVILHIFSLNFLPYPFNFINVLFIWLFWLLFISSSKKNALPIVFALFLIELLSAASFGTASASAILSLMLIGWFLNRFFTNKTFFVLAVFFMIGLLIRKIFTFIFHIMLFGAAQNMFALKHAIIDIVWESALTGGVFIIVYSLLRRYIRPLSPAYVQGN